MNGCYNREPLKESMWAQDGYFEGVVSETRYPRMVEIADPMTKDCQYSRTTQDAKCAGCRWNHGGGE